MHFSDLFPRCSAQVVVTVKYTAKTNTCAWKRTLSAWVTVSGDVHRGSISVSSGSDVCRQRHEVAGVTHRSRS